MRTVASGTAISMVGGGAVANVKVSVSVAATCVNQVPIMENDQMYPKI